MDIWTPNRPTEITEHLKNRSNRPKAALLTGQLRSCVFDALIQCIKYCPDQETLAPHDYIAGFLFPRTGLTCFFLGAERDGKGVYRRYGEILRPHWHVQTHHRSSKVFLRQKKSRSDFFWRRPCDRSAQTTGRREAGLAGTANAELAGTANAELAGKANVRTAFMRNFPKYSVP